MTFSRILLIGTLLVVPFVRSATAEDWKNFRGPGGQGYSSETNLPATWSDDENLTWKTVMPGAGSSSPISLGDKIYLTCFSGYGIERGKGSLDDLKLHLVCVNSKDGKIEWDTKIDSRQPESKNVRDHGYAAATPATDGKHIYAFFGKTGVVKFDLNGKKIWQTPVGDGVHGWGCGTSPVLYKNLVIVNASVESKELWRARVGANVASPVVYKDHLYWVSDRNTIAYCLRLSDGEVVYRERVDSQPYASALIADDKIYVVTRRGGTIVLAAKPEFEVLAKNKLADRAQFNASPIVSGGRIYLRSDKNLYCIAKKGG